MQYCVKTRPPPPPPSLKRTKSFEPAWWGSTLTTTTNNNNIEDALQPNNDYPPVHTLILGTHPSITSLAKQELYGHPQNAFWYIAGDALQFRRCMAISHITSKPYATFYNHLRYSNILDYPQQLERVVSRGFALWDIVAECHRVGSLDTNIQGEVANPIREFCEGTLYDNEEFHHHHHKRENFNIQRIIIANGTTGAKFFVKHFTNWFMEGSLRAGTNDMSQQAFRGVMNKVTKAMRKDGGGINHQRMIEVVVLPGVSPAAASITYPEKREAWEKGCYTPGLVDYENWKNHRHQQSSVTIADIDPCVVTPTDTRVQSTYQGTTTTTPSTPNSHQKKVVASPSSPSKESTVHILSSDLAMLVPENEWIDLGVPPQELRPSATLTNGQCFNWLVVERGTVMEDTVAVAASPPPKSSAWGTHDAQEWIGPLNDRVLSIRETPTTTMFRVLCGPTERAREDLRQYFRLETALAPLYDEWSTQDARLAKIAKAIPGVRIVRQDPHECLFSFICTSNNNIPRITKILSSIREKYGMFLMEVPTRHEGRSSRGGGGGGEMIGTLSLFSFPTLAALADATEQDLRALGLGYRAKFVIETRNLLVECGGDDYLLSLRNQRYGTAVQAELIKFCGIGRKVADCIALFSLDQDDAIPVDVHVQHIASRDYDPGILGDAKSITPTVYKRVGDLFRNRFANHPGWAHSLLFVAELPSFRNVLPVDVVSEMDHWRKEEQRKMKEIKEEKKKNAT